MPHNEIPPWALEIQKGIGRLEEGQKRIDGWVGAVSRAQAEHEKDDGAHGSKAATTAQTKLHSWALVILAAATLYITLRGQTNGPQSQAVPIYERAGTPHP